MNRLITSLRTNVNTARRVFAIGAAAPNRARRRRAARAYFSQHPPGSIINASEVDTLRADGFVPWTPTEETIAALTSSFADLCTEREHGHASTVQRSTGKRFFQETLTERDLAQRPAFVDAALDNRLLMSVAAAMGMVPHLESIEVLISNPIPQALSASQLWHRDVNDKVTIKLFVYLNDVGVRQGPFTFIPAQPAERVPRNIGHYMTDAQIDQYLTRDCWRAIEGSTGTAFLVDTSRCLHFGSRCEEPRIAYISTYSSGIKFTKYSHAWQSILGARAAELNKLQRMVCGIDAIG